MDRYHRTSPSHHQEHNDHGNRQKRTPTRRIEARIESGEINGYHNGRESPSERRRRVLLAAEEKAGLISNRKVPPVSNLHSDIRQDHENIWEHPQNHGVHRSIPLSEEFEHPSSALSTSKEPVRVQLPKMELKITENNQGHVEIFVDRCKHVTDVDSGVSRQRRRHRDRGLITLVPPPPHAKTEKTQMHRTNGSTERSGVKVLENRDKEYLLSETALRNIIQEALKDYQNHLPSQNEPRYFHDVDVQTSFVSRHSTPKKINSAVQPDSPCISIGRKRLKLEMVDEQVQTSFALSEIEERRKSRLFGNAMQQSSLNTLRPSKIPRYVPPNLRSPPGMGTTTPTGRPPLAAMEASSSSSTAYHLSSLKFMFIHLEGITLRQTQFQQVCHNHPKVLSMVWFIRVLQLISPMS